MEMKKDSLSDPENLVQVAKLFNHQQIQVHSLKTLAQTLLI
jgi:hypothetical protein